jgi:hypothetical protein
MSNLETDQNALAQYKPPVPERTSKAPKRRALRFDTVRVTAWTYAAYFVTLVPIYTFSIQPLTSAGTRQLQWLLWTGCAGAAASAAFKRKLGYYFCAVFSALILFSPPFGTIFGWNMLRALRRNRDEFRSN